MSLGNGRPPLDKEKLRELYQSNPVAKGLMDALVGPSKNVVNTADDGFVPTRVTVEQVMEHTKCERSQAVKILQQFATHGCGRFVTGRRSLPSRLEWAVGDLVRLAKEITGNSESALPTADYSGEIKLVEQLIWLRPSVQVSVRFPQDMTQEEAEKVAGVVRNLWLSSAAGKD